MYLSSHDALLFAGAISILFVSGFLCWVLCELARLLHQTNQLVEETHEKINRVEAFVEEITERIGSASQYLGIMATAGKEIFGWVRDRKKMTEPDEDEDLFDELPRKRKKR
jgi:uncharacterized protein YoxC